MTPARLAEIRACSARHMDDECECPSDCGVGLASKELLAWADALAADAERDAREMTTALEIAEHVGMRMKAERNAALKVVRESCGHPCYVCSGNQTAAEVAALIAERDAALALAETERAMIVAWLRKSQYGHDNTRKWLTAQIEHGVHHDA